jgi:hypothetical protein
MLIYIYIQILLFLCWPLYIYIYPTVWTIYIYIFIPLFLCGHLALFRPFYVDKFMRTVAMWTYRNSCIKTHNFYMERCRGYREHHTLEGRHVAHGGRCDLSWTHSNTHRVVQSIATSAVVASSNARKYCGAQAPPITWMRGQSVYAYKNNHGTLQLRWPNTHYA